MLKNNGYLYFYKQLKVKLKANIFGHDYHLLLGDDDEDALLPVLLVGVEQCDLAGGLVFVGLVLRVLGHLTLKHCDYLHNYHHYADQITVSFHHLYDEERHHYGHSNYHLMFHRCGFDCLNFSIFVAGEAFCDLGIDYFLGHFLCIPANFY